MSSLLRSLLFVLVISTVSFGVGYKFSTIFIRPSFDKLIVSAQSISPDQDEATYWKNSFDKKEQQLESCYKDLSTIAQEHHYEVICIEQVCELKDK